MAEFRTFLFEGGRGKLVYDGFLADHKAFRAKVDYVKLSPAERDEALKAKLQEEQAELEQAQTPEERLKEERDVQDVLFALGELMIEGYVPGRWFTLGTYVHAVSLPTDPGNEDAAYWIKYYASRPDRFPEVVR